MSTTVFGIKIILNDSAAPFVEDTTIGLYNVVSDNSVFKWLQNSISGVTGWNTTMISSIGNWTREIDLRNGGAVAYPGNASVTLHNTSQLQEALKDNATAPIYLAGNIFEIWEYVDTVATRRWIGICQEPKWTETTYTITAQGIVSSLKANLSTLIQDSSFADTGENTNATEIIPLTFGKHKPKIKSDGSIKIATFAKFKRVRDDLTYYKNSFRDSSSGLPSFSGDNNGVDSFHVVGADDGLSPSKIWRVALHYQYYPIGITPATADTSYAEFVGMFLHVIQGNGEGEFRKITAARWDQSAVNFVFTLDQYPTTEYAGNASGTATNQTWVEIVSSNRIYQDDVWPNKAYLDINGNEITENFSLFSYDKRMRVDVTTDEKRQPVEQVSGGYVRIGSSTVAAVSSDSDKRTVSAIPSMLTNDINTISDFVVYPMSWGSVEPFNRGGTYPDVRISSSEEYDHYFKTQNGLFVWGEDSQNQFDYDFTFTLLKTDEYANCTLSIKDHPETKWKRHFIALSIDLPSIPDDFEFEAAYFIGRIRYIRAIQNSDISESKLLVRAIPRTYGYSSEISTSAFDDDLSAEKSYDIEYKDVPTFVDSVGGDNKNFYVNNNYGATISDGEYVSGYQRFELVGIKTVSEYRRKKKVVIMACENVDYDTGTMPNTFTLRLYSPCAIVFKKTSSIENALYMPHSGRIFNDTWSSRKTSASLMQSPIDMLEHVCRLQCWAFNSTVPAAGWGRGYASGALIKTSGSGSFDDATDSTFSYVKGFDAASQILDYESAYTDAIKRTICRDFALMSWIDGDGKECVKSVAKTGTYTVADVLTLADVVDRKQIRIDEPSIQNVYPEPFVRFNIDPETGKPQSSIRVTNASAASYSAGYVTGTVSGGIAEQLWTWCHEIWLRCKHLEKPPADLTDLAWANGPDAYAIAENYFINWVNGMFNPTITIPIHYSKGKSWNEGHIFSIELPHQTDDVAITCIAEKLSFSATAPHDIMVEATLLKDSLPVDYRIQDVMSILAGDDLWADTYATGDDITDDM